MHINCLICTDIFTPNSDIYSTPCGHIFHYHCLLHWLENSKTCPQCRTKITVKSLVRLYVNVATSQDTEVDITVMQHKMDGMEFQLRLKDKDIKNFTEKYKVLEEQNKALRVTVKQLEMTEMKHESVMAALKDQIKFFKQKSLSCDKLLEQVNQLKSQVKNLENVEAAISGSRQQVEDIIRNENNVESLALLAATLKKTLVDTDRKKRELRIELKKVQNELSMQKRKVAQINSEYEDNKRQLESLKLSYQGEITYLKNKFAEIHLKTILNDSVNDSIKRITLESPVNYNRTPVVNNKQQKVIDLTNSPVTSQTETDHHTIKPIIVNTPPLPATSMGVLAIQAAKMASSGADQNKFSIFKNKQQPPPLEPVNIQTTKYKKCELSYDGFGGSSKEDVFPSPQRIHLKRPKLSKSASSLKFKKLSADAGKPNRKMSDFLN